MEIARELLYLFDDEMIAQKTGLSVEEIKNLYMNKCLKESSEKQAISGLSIEDKALYMLYLEDKRIAKIKAEIYSYKLKFVEEMTEKYSIKKAEYSKAFEIAKNLLDILDDETISQKTGLSIEEIKKLRE